MLLEEVVPPLTVSPVGRGFHRNTPADNGNHTARHRGPGEPRGATPIPRSPSEDTTPLSATARGRFFAHAAHRLIGDSRDDPEFHELLRQ
jgi:hypothetical protein